MSDEIAFFSQPCPWSGGKRVNCAECKRAFAALEREGESALCVVSDVNVGLALSARGLGRKKTYHLFGQRAVEKWRRELDGQRMTLAKPPGSPTVVGLKKHEALRIKAQALVDAMPGVSVSGVPEKTAVFSSALRTLIEELGL